MLKSLRKWISRGASVASALYQRSGWPIYAGLVTAAALVTYLYSLEWCGSLTEGLSVCGVRFWQRVTELVYDFQTLLTGVAAICAALITTSPMRRQLRLMATQSSIMARDQVAKRLTETMERRSIFTDRFGKVKRCFETILPYDDGEDFGITPEWAHGTQQEVFSLRRFIKKDADQLSDPKNIERKKLALRERLHTVAECLGDIHRPHSGDLWDPENEPSLEQQKVERERANQAAELACSQLWGHYTRAENAHDDLRREFGERIIGLRKLLREIDDALTTTSLNG